MDKPIGRSPSSAVDFLALGAITQDLVGEMRESLTSEDYRLGGTVSFAAITALRLGRQPTILTRASTETDFSELPQAVDLRLLPSERTTTFANLYRGRNRQQYVYAPMAPIEAGDIDGSLRRARAVLLGPLVDDIGVDVPPVFSKETLVAAVPQGWMRQWDETGRVERKPWTNAEQILPHLDVLVLSIEDIGYDLSALIPLSQQVSRVVLTESRNGSTLYLRDRRGRLVTAKIPPRPAREVDPTGAGDIFAAAFVLRLQEIGDPIHAARFANVTASFGVEGEGVSAIPTREQVLRYMAAQPIDPLLVEME